ncbi:MAG: asparagine synthase (glutamine-hydrolyzing) [Alphaproteobacteria bacterium]|nr:asparagine synthase (glutamine-hydrolyzing) [Alphaproteobacteria bacterium]OJV47049.1 MAG: asparagine synthase (glutamine-hydrolyzing) [Alphaproteobacteria bacterium 43-37]
MCGIAGIWIIHSDFKGSLHDAVSNMAMAIAHRGPDGQGVWVDKSNKVALGHRRLATVDLSPTGAQPMTSHCGRYVLIYNGELYQSSGIRDQLKSAGISFAGTSDTEVLLEAIAAFGVEEALSKLDGMFAFCVFDVAQNKMTLVRDRFGVKPLYVYYDQKICAFASELKAFKVLPQLVLKINPQAAQCYKVFGFVPSPLSIYENVIQLCPGEMLDVTEAGIQKKQYWTRESLVALRVTDIGSALAAVEMGLEHAIQGMLEADVPVGVFLSGGIDSTLVAAMAAKMHRGIQAFTLGFSGAYDESTIAAHTASHLGLNHKILQAGPKDIVDTVIALPHIYDEPFADASQIPTFLLSRLARAHVTVALSGDGGDEAFAGYERHHLIPKLMKWQRYLPKTIMRSLLAIAANTACLSIFHAMGYKFLSQKIHKISRLLGADDLPTAYLNLLNQTDCNFPLEVKKWLKNLSAGSDLRKLMAMDGQFYLPAVLEKVDRASMANALEVRVPFLDLHVQSVAARLDDALLVAGGKGKAVLRYLAQKHAPHVANLPKAGFSVPLGEWLRGPLREIAAGSMRQDYMEPIFGEDTARFTAAWQQCLAGDDRYAQSAWIGLMGAMWSNRWSS